MNAKEAREKAYMINISENNSKYAEIKRLIEIEVGSGGYSIWYEGNIHNDIINKLKEEGFVFEVGSQYNQTFYNIKW